MSYQIDTVTWRSPNYSERTQPIESLVIHSCEGVWPTPRSSSLPWLCKPESPTHPDPVSCHYYVCRNTEIFQLVDDDQAAWHAGVALPRWDNASSIGIELEHRAGMNWPAVQKDALAWLIRHLIAAHRIPMVAVETHGQIAIKGPYIRKKDPSDWPHADFVAWRQAVASPLVRTVKAGPRGAIAQQDRRPDAPTAGLWYPPGSWIQVDDLTSGYWHASDGIGFIPRGQVEE